MSTDLLAPDLSSDPRVAYRSDGGYTVHAYNDLFQVLYRPALGWCICRGDQYDADPYLGELAADPQNRHVVVGYESATAAILVLTEGA